MNTVSTCQHCGKRLPPDAPEGLCPECLMRGALATTRIGAAAVEAGAAAGSGARGRGLPRAGELFGGYRIVRELGRGGMGAVYAAEQLESGRLVALKVLSRQLDSPEARKRFLREGRLAASINHPNSVYVYGTDDIDGTPVIAMELVAGGTLQQRVQEQGPLPVAQAVDAILDIIAGLEAAQVLGILHRDIKPSNCFQDSDGTVKVGDFGLSISTAARGDSNVTVQGALLGTPAFASPEQLRGEELNARSDLYAVGVTLFYLLTGHTPFEAQNMVQLMANVLEQPAPSPRTLRPAIPPDLARLVLRCLEKQPAERFRTYDELRQGLMPFSSTVPVAATPVIRLAAGALDLLAVGIVGMAMCLLVFGDLLPLATATAARPAKMVPMVVAAFLMVLVYYSVCEGLWGAGVGKMICRLRLAGADRNPPGIPRAALRSLVFQILPALPYWVSFGFDPTRFLVSAGPAMQYTLSSLYYLVAVLLFCTARKRNGYAGVHDLIAGTRVVRKAAYPARPLLAAAVEAPHATGTQATVGPYHILDRLGRTATGEWLLGYDPQLLRRVWIQSVPPGTSPVAAGLRNLGRVGRLRWLAGRRTDAENWDAFEGVAGRPLLSLLAAPQPWSQVRFWLLDLGRELQAAEKDGSLPSVLDLDRVWITAEGRAKLLDVPAPGLPPVVRPPALPGVSAARSAPEFLSQVARAALAGQLPAASGPAARELAVPLPLPARDFLERLPTLPALDAVVAALEPLLQQVASVSRLRRAGVVAACAVFPVLAGFSMLVGTAMIARWERQQPGVWELSQLLHIRSAMRMPWARQPDAPDDRLVAIYIAGHYRAVVTHTSLWSSMYAVAMIAGENRRFAEKSVADYPSPTAEEVREATAELRPLLAGLQASGVAKHPWFPLLACGVSWIVYVALPALLAALLFRGGLVLRALRLAVVRRDGAEASRLRVLWRCMVAWAPLLLAPLPMLLLRPALGVTWAVVLPVLLLGGLVTWSILLPDRSLQDRIAGTCLVPR